MMGVVCDEDAPANSFRSCADDQVLAFGLWGIAAGTSLGTPVGVHLANRLGRAPGVLRRHRRGIRRKRAFAAVRWDTVFAVGGVEDTILRMPRTIVARGVSLYVFDYDDDQLEAFDHPGRRRD